MSYVSLAGLVIGLLLLTGCAATAEAPLPRIAVRDGRFVVTGAGREFRPHGFNYIRLRPKWHGTFAPGVAEPWRPGAAATQPAYRYEPQRAEAMLADLSAHGFNVVRVFIDPAARQGVIESEDAADLSPAYMANVLDFLRRARRHGIYVVPSLLDLPRGKTFAVDERTVGWANRTLLLAEGIQAKARYGARFVRWIKDSDAGLLSTVLAYELDNETHFDAGAPPLALTAGTFTGVSGKTYDLGSDVEKQALADDHAVLHADACVAAIREVDPAALVSINVFTFAAVGRSGPAAFSRDSTKDRRFPARPVALARSTLSYIDVHFYPFDGQTLPRDLGSIEFASLRVRCRERGLPLVMGEFGAFKKAHPTLDAAAAAMRRHWQDVAALGFAGFLFWTYDTDEQRDLWNAKSDGGVLFKALAEMR